MLPQIRIASLLVLLGASRGFADELQDGIYAFRLDGAGPRITLSNQTEGVLGPMLGNSWVGVEIRSVTNDNSQFAVRLSGIPPLKYRKGYNQVVLAIDGNFLLPHGQSGESDGPRTIWFRGVGQADLRKITQRLKVKPTLRKPPGHRLETKWTPAQERYAVGERVILTMEIKNVGDVPVRFRNGGQQRGPRNNQFHFVAYRASGLGSVVPDTGESWHMGGLSSDPTLKPGEKFRLTECLDGWFEFDEAGTYWITGMYELEMYDATVDDWFDAKIWDDYAIGSCRIRITAKAK